MANKIKYGIKNVYYAVATIGANNAATYDTPVALPGAVSLTLDQEGENNIFYADNIAYFSTYANDGYTGSLELALVPDSFRQDVLGEILDNKSVLAEDQNAPSVHFALLFQFEGDSKAKRHVLYNCKASRPRIASQTTDTTITPVTETLSIKASARLSDGVVKASTKLDDTASAQYTGWFTAVYVPSV